MQKNHNTLNSGNEKPGFIEFVALMAFTMSLVAMCIDAMLPAFPMIGSDLQIADANDLQLIISVLFIGLALGQMFYGPLSDTTGRKPAIYAGYAVFIAGTVLSMLAETFTVMLVGRFLQGLGAAGPRVVATALIRDQFSGSEMARVMSFVMTVFILVPIFAPAWGQLILMFSGWRTIFASFLLLGLMTLIWLAVRQPETLFAAERLPFSLNKLRFAFGMVFSNRQTMIYTLITGCISGAFFGYLNLCQQVFQVQYALGPQFPLYFAILAVAVGAASLLNSSMVMKLGMHALANDSLRVMMGLSWVFMLLVWLSAGQPQLWLFVLNFLALFFCIGVLFGNLNAIAMEPLGKYAGTGASVVGSLSTLMAVVIGFLVGHAYDGTLFSMAIGFSSMTTVSVVLSLFAKLEP